MANVMIEGENGSQMVDMSDSDLKRAKVLLRKYQNTGDWADELNDIIQRSRAIACVGTIITSGDGGGWYPEK